MTLSRYESLILKYMDQDPAARLVVDVAIRNAIDLAYLREERPDDYLDQRAELDEEIDDLLPSIQALNLKSILNQGAR